MARTRIDQVDNAAPPEVDAFRGHLRIDREALDDALMEQPELFFHVAEKQALAKSRRDQLKDQVKQIDAQLYMDLRVGLTESGHRITENAMAAEVEASKRHIRAREAFHVASYEADIWEALKEAFIQRSYMLKDLVGLYVTQYHSSASVRGGDSEQFRDEAYEQRKKDLAVKRKERRREQ